tara:strand:- start:39 stop:425 length:387 start_codon:yes stop_codon:yes gene_type:complete
MIVKNTTRIDKWLWSMRIFKTRSLAVEACNKGNIKINNLKVKPSRNIKIGEIIQVRKGTIKYLYKIKDITNKRINSKLVINYLEDITPEDEIIKIKSSQNKTFIFREKGKGRPTKKERRLMEKFKNIN